MNVVFSYGSLRRGYSNHYLLQNSEYIGNYSTGPGYKKIINGLPYLLEDPSGEGTVGEAYLVSDLTLSLLDRLEGHDQWYVRKNIWIYGENETRRKAWCYIMPKERINVR